ncbi:hypothetical protein [Xenorhabdus kozodoii]|uniref:Uncharacterized protein n=1 Tax=Xenorhabdus kozodoii TaxID=351676 RepID=A0A2D0L4P7_9GAMM|nr:hypothetical protein [Xenorhabdus kozodoii]PHM70663.1 hypothetical protein Xkoz_03107 [Xenorhabdus kozodoii]
MFRSKSFNINRPITLGSLTHAKSVSDMARSVSDARAFITVKEVSVSEASNITNRITTTTMTSEWGDVFYQNLPDNEQEKWSARYYSTYGMFEVVYNEARLLLKKTIQLKINVFFAAYFKNVPIGILLFSSKVTGDAIPEVEFLVTHCGIRNCGVLLDSVVMRNFVQ